MISRLHSTSGLGVRPARYSARKWANTCVAVLIGKVHAMQDDAELGGDRARILVVLRRGAVAVVLFPVAHEQALHVVAGIAQQQRRDRGIDAAGQADDDALASRRACGAVLCGVQVLAHRPIVIGVGVIGVGVIGVGRVWRLAPRRRESKIGRKASFIDDWQSLSLTETLPARPTWP